MALGKLNLQDDPFGQQAINQAVNITTRQLVGKFGSLAPLSEMTLNEDPEGLDAPMIGKSLGGSVFMEFNDDLTGKIVDFKNELVTMLKAEGVLSADQDFELNDKDKMEIMEEWLESSD